MHSGLQCLIEFFLFFFTDMGCCCSNGDTALSWEASNRWEMVSSGVSRKILGVAEKVSLRQRFAHSGANSSVRFTRFDSEIRLKGRSTTEVSFLYVIRGSGSLYVNLNMNEPWMYVLQLCCIDD